MGFAASVIAGTCSHHCQRFQSLNFQVRPQCRRPGGGDCGSVCGCFRNFLEIARQSRVGGIKISVEISRFEFRERDDLIEDAAIFPDDTVRMRGDFGFQRSEVAESEVAEYFPLTP